MEQITRTIYGSYLQTCLLLNRPFSMKANSTLNEKFSILSGIFPDVSEAPRMKYWAIGNGGHRLSVGADGTAIPEPIQHRATDAACFHHLPFVLREPSADLPSTERIKYGMRREETHNGVRYIAYYLRRMKLSGVTPAMEYKTVVAGTVTATPFVPDSSNLSPQPPILSPSGVGVVTGDQTTASAKVSLLLTPADVEELLNVAEILYANTGYAIISEIALVSGVDKMTQSPSVGSTTIQFNDVIAAQVATHISTFFPLKYANNGVEMILEVGASEPLFALTAG